MNSKERTDNLVEFLNGRTSEARLLDVLLENSREGVALVDWRGNIRRINRAFARMMHQPHETLEGKNIVRLISHSEDRALLEEIVETLWQDGYWSGNIRPWLAQDSKNTEMFLKISAILPSNGKIRFFLCQLSEIRILRSSVVQTMEQARDPLTNLATRSLFVDRLEQAISGAKRHRRSLGVLILDLDRFKLINDSLGHELGDEMLRIVAARLIQCLRTSDSVARIGFDEFGMLLTDIDEGTGAIRNSGFVARKIYDALARPAILGSQEVELSVAIGITLFPQDAQDSETLLKNAETALDHARRRGRNNYQFFSAEMAETARKRFAMESSLRHAMERDELKLYYQPQVDLGSGQVMGAEALIRWFHPEKGMISPADFIPIAEETGLIVPIGEWVIRTACRQIAAWKVMNLPAIRVGVNLSPLQFQRQDVVGIIKDVLQETGIDPASLDLEITESAIMEDVEKAIRILASISALGVHLSIDDFGTGYSSLSQLRHFPFKTLKIDRSFVRFITENNGDKAIVNAIIAMAHSLDQNVIVEGLETEGQLAVLRALNCNQMQGFLFSAAVPPEELTQMLREGRRLPFPQTVGSENINQKWGH
ncbi:MAG: EAL domain-containing protein [Magnetococcales bacterium]|nr:EAL domain-containing protein [Magnetococcales bacterium]MBF0149626.1 EAL domain-containing protein [Magnetococcales bacterium]MBF0632102.1 EAL domain-containing protein [Magnetococcales bacterium]